MEAGFFKEIGGSPVQRIHPNCRQFEYDSDTYWECFVRSNTLTVYHPVGTCRMGPDGDASSVVDHKLRYTDYSQLVKWHIEWIVRFLRWSIRCFCFLDFHNIYTASKKKFPARSKHFHGGGNLYTLH